MAESMIERVARALFEADYPNPGEVEEGSWETGRVSYLQSARAAIDAMREPTDAMKSAAKAYRDEWPQDQVDEPADFFAETFTKQWDAALDAALKEQP